MSVADYDTLRSAVLSYAARSDSTFTAMFPTFVALAEERLYNGGGKPGDDLYSPPLRSKAMEVASTITITSGSGTWPDDVCDVRKISRSGDTQGLVYMTPERIAVELARYASTGLPLYYTIEGETIKVAPSSDTTLDVLYFAQYPAITASNTAGQLIVAHGLLYLHLCLFEAFAWMQEEALAVAHFTKARSMIEGANQRANSGRTPGPVQIRPRRIIGA